MRKLLTILLLLSASAAQAHAQGQPAPPAARLIDSFGEIQLSDLMARLDNFAVELWNDPSAQGAIVSYAARHKFPAWPVRRARSALIYLAETRGFDATRLTMINGGLSDDTAFELWLVPAGAEPPAQPFDTSLLMSGEKTPLLFDRFVVIERGDNWESYDGDPYPDAAYLYAYFAEVLRRDPSLRGCVIGYTSWGGARVADRRIASRAKSTVAKNNAIDVGRVVALGGGRRQFKTIELWLVPPGAALPRPSPERRPARRRRR